MRNHTREIEYFRKIIHFTPILAGMHFRSHTKPQQQFHTRTSPTLIPPTPNLKESLVALPVAAEADYQSL